MLWAVIAHLSVLHAPPTAPLVLLAGLLVVASARRAELAVGLGRLAPRDQPGRVSVSER